MIEIKDLHVEVDGNPIIKGFSLKVLPGEIHAIMGPNGAGKSTLAKVLAGHPSYDVTKGEVWFKGQNLLELDPDQRAHLGLFMSFQYPVEIHGVSNVQFLKTACNAQRKARNELAFTEEEFLQLLDQKMEMIEIKQEFKERNLNEGFSGGEKKRNEILQMAMLNPELTILDETDSGLDIDAMRIVAHGVNRFMTPEKGLILITHYQRLLDYIKPQFVHVMMDGKIAQSGGAELALELEKRGYDWISASQGQG
jgi:Fe-S cluster assembly ATP-binding protein